MEKPSKPTKQPLPRVAHLVLVGVAFGLSYSTFSVAVDKGSILLYVATLVLMGLGIRHLVQAFPIKGAK